MDECGGFGVAGHSSPNFLAFNLNALMSDGGIPRGPETITFTPLAASVTINSGHSSSGTITMECFDSSSASVGSDSIAGTSALAPLTVTASGIQSCVLSFTGSVAVFDDLLWEAAAGPPVPAVSYQGVMVLVLLLLLVSTVFLFWLRRSAA